MIMKVRRVIGILFLSQLLENLHGLVLSQPLLGLAQVFIQAPAIFVKHDNLPEQVQADLHRGRGFEDNPFEDPNAILNLQRCNPEA